ncbi:MAG: ATP-binding protein [Caulobacteraceae bacterium]
MKRGKKELFLVGLFTAIMGQVHFYPFGTDFRITIGVIIFTFLILYFQNLPIIQTSLFTGICVLLVRLSIDTFTKNEDIYLAFVRHIPALMYYLTYGIIIDIINFRKYIEKPVYFIVIISAADILSNFIELIIRNQIGAKSFEAIFSTILLTAVIRSCFVLVFYWMIRYYNLLITKEEHQRRYKELLLLSAKLKSEIVFLKKSMQDIENAMVKSYSIYNMIKESNGAENNVLEKIMSDCLALSVDIHEIKKDYNRIVISMEKLMPASDGYKNMKLSEVFEAINDIFTRYLEVVDKDIQLSFEIEKDFKMDSYITIISILNNLIQNSIEACSEMNSYIKVKSFIDKENIVFTVTDNGKGIKESDKKLIFEPGYTTKFNPETGQLSTGLGLTHIKMLTEHLGGSVRLNDEIIGVTEFILEFPAEVIMVKEEYDE